jgi:hypothetical protein
MDATKTNATGRKGVSPICQNVSTKTRQLAVPRQDNARLSAACSYCIAAKHQPAEDRNVVVKPDMGLAIGTCRARKQR